MFIFYFNCTFLSVSLCCQVWVRRSISDFVQILNLLIKYNAAYCCIDVGARVCNRLTPFMCMCALMHTHAFCLQLCTLWSLGLSGLKHQVTVSIVLHMSLDWGRTHDSWVLRSPSTSSAASQQPHPIVIPSPTHKMTHISLNIVA